MHGSDHDQRRLGQAFAVMTADEQQVIVLGYFEGPTSSEIAEQLGTPIGDDAEGELDARDATVLRLMAAGVTDAAIARQTGFSQRTVERRVRHVMERLGAQTRFQAGVQAVHRGWL